jgi:RNA polymerase sigma factor (sigma-70 family)
MNMSLLYAVRQPACLQALFHFSSPQAARTGLVSIRGLTLLDFRYSPRRSEPVRNAPESGLELYLFKRFLGEHEFMVTWTKEAWRQALSGEDIELERAAYAELGRYLIPVARRFLTVDYGFDDYLRTQTDASLDNLALQMVNETLPVVWQTRSAWRGDCKLTTWAYSILRNKIREMLRKHTHERLTSFQEADSDRELQEDKDEPDLTEVHIYRQRPDNEYWLNPERKFHQRELGQWIQKGLDSLSPKQRAAFNECCVNDRPVSQVAQELEMSQEAFYKSISRARQNLIQFLLQNGVVSAPPPTREGKHENRSV